LHPQEHARYQYLYYGSFVKISDHCVLWYSGIMKVILLQDVAKIGSRYEVKEVARGFAQNFLIPRGLVETATRSALASLEHRKAQAAEKVTASDALAEEVLATLDGKKLSLTEKANEQGHLFASVHEKEIAEAIQKEFGLSWDPSRIRLPEPIKEVGEYEVALALGEKKAILKLHIKTDKG
jgi:large subunit ribosomal protein L9